MNVDLENVRLSEVLSALSYALDIVEGQPEGHILRSYFIGMKIGEKLGLSEEDRSALFYALLLKDAGCSSNASKITALFGSDDFEVKKAFKTVNWNRLPQALMYVARTVSPEDAIWTKARKFLTIGIEGQEGARQLVLIRCERGAEIVRLMGFPEASAQAIRNLDEHWDGQGHPDGLKKDSIPLLSRFYPASIPYLRSGPDSGGLLHGLRPGARGGHGEGLTRRVVRPGDRRRIPFPGAGRFIVAKPGSA